MAGRADHTDPNCQERVCHDFKSWMIQSGKNAKTDSSEAKAGSSSSAEPAEAADGHDCPPDKDSLGRGSWGLLHSIAAHFPAKPSASVKEDAAAFLHSFSRLYPCAYCAKDMRRDLREEPPVLTSRDDFAQWLCRLHNKVNAKTGKAAFDCDPERLRQRWRDGPDDGSCG